MINIFLLAMIACGEKEEQDTAPTDEPVEETHEESNWQGGGFKAF